MASDDGPLDVRVLTPVGPLFEGSATMVFAPSSAGEVGLLPRHEPLVCTLRYGRTRVRGSEGTEEVFATTEGFLTIDQNHVLILVAQAVRLSDIDAGRARADLQAAEDALETAGDNEAVRTRAEAEKHRAENLLKVLESSS